MAKPNSVIPAPPHTEEEPFEIGDTLTVFAAAMIYAGRHPHSRFLRNGSIEDHVQFMRAGIREREPRTKIRARRSWDIYCELINRIKQRRLTPVKSAYLEDGEVDPRRTVIEIADLVLLANERGEQPKYLKHLLRAADYRASKRRLTRNEAGTFTAEYIATEDVLQWPALKALLQKRSCVEVESCSATSFVKCRGTWGPDVPKNNSPKNNSPRICEFRFFTTLARSYARVQREPWNN